jgi:hypothetical protein
MNRTRTIVEHVCSIEFVNVDLSLTIDVCCSTRIETSLRCAPHLCFNNLMCSNRPFLFRALCHSFSLSLSLENLRSICKNKLSSRHRCYFILYDYLGIVAQTTRNTVLSLEFARRTTTSIIRTDDSFIYISC